MIHNSDKQRYNCGHDMKKQQQQQQHSEEDRIFFRVSAYESFKSKLTSNSPINPLSVRGRLRECKNAEFLWALKRGFVMAVVSRAIRYIRVCPLRELLLYESANDRLNEK